jgi:hypothetical protein
MIKISPAAFSIGFAVMALCSGCATSYSPRHIEYTMKQAAISANELADAGKTAEAVRFIDAISDVDENYPDLKDLRTKCNVSGEIATTKHPWLGSNVRSRGQADRAVITKILLYIPDRLLDIADIFSFDLNFGGGAFANLHATRAIQGGVGLRSVAGIGWHDNRSLGFESQKEAGVNVIALGSQAYSATRVGTSGIQDVSDAIVGFHKPSDRLYQEYRDYWAFGFSATVLFIGFDFDFHPVQVVDLLGGIVGFDLCNDDFARTCSLHFDALDRQLLTDLGKIKQYKESTGGN